MSDIWHLVKFPDASGLETGSLICNYLKLSKEQKLNKMFVYICMNKNGLLGIGKIPPFVIHPFNGDEKLNFEALLVFSINFWL